MSTSPAQVAANRANSLRSCGPKTSEGRAVSAANSIKHGARASSIRLLPSENAQEWEDLLSELRNEWSPETPTEQLLLERLATAEWRRRRAEVFELGGLRFEGAGSEADTGMAFVRDCHKGQTISLALRYRRSANAEFMSAMHELERAQARRKGTTVPLPAVVDVNVSSDFGGQALPDE